MAELKKEDFKPVLVSGSTVQVGIAPLTIQFKNTSTGGKDLKFKWDFGDGGHSDKEHPTYTFLNEGIYLITLYVKNENGIDKKSATIVVKRDEKLLRDEPILDAPVFGPVKEASD